MIASISCYDYLAHPTEVEIEVAHQPIIVMTLRKTSADEAISETASVSNHIESEEELSLLRCIWRNGSPSSKDEEADLIDSFCDEYSRLSDCWLNLSLVAKIAESHRGKSVNFRNLFKGNVGLMLAVSDYTESVMILIHLFWVELEDAIRVR